MVIFQYSKQSVMVADNIWINENEMKDYLDYINDVTE